MSAPDSISSDVMPPLISTSMTLGEFVNLGRFRPAAVQRGFEWEPAEAEKLLSDITATFLEVFDGPSSYDEAETDDGDEEDDDVVDLVPSDSPDEDAWSSGSDGEPPVDVYFIGSIVLRQFAPAQFEIFDGYQRTTILMILLAVLRDLNTDAAGKTDCANLTVSEGEPRLATPDRDNTLRTILTGDGGARALASYRGRRPGVGKRQRDIATAFVSALEPWSAEKTAAFIRFLLHRVFVNLIEVRERKVGRQVFVSTNLFGKQLDPIDLLKGQLADTTASEREAAEIVERWDMAREYAGDQFVDVVCAQDVITRRQVQGDQWPIDLADHITHQTYAQATVKWLKALQHRAKSWRRIKRVLANGGENAVEREMWRLRAFHWKEWHPVALLFFDEYDNARESGDAKRLAWTQRLFARLHKRCMGMVLAGFGFPNQPADRKKIMVRAVNQWRERRDPTTKSGALTFNRAQRLKMERALIAHMGDEHIYVPLMMWLEASRWREGAPEQMKVASVEHVLSRNPRGETADADEFASHAAQCNAIGNLAVIPRSVNFDLQNEEFDTKHAAFLDKCGDYWTAQSVVEHKTWGAVPIEERSAMLTAEVWKQLGLTPPRES